MKMTKEQREKYLPLFCIAIFALLWTVGANTFAWLSFNGQAINRINFANWAARDLHYDVEANAEALSLPKNGEKWVTGRADSYANFVLTAYTDAGKQIDLYRLKDKDLCSYWTAYVRDGEVQESWLSKHPLEESELHPYTWQMQRDTVRFVIFPLPHWFYDDRQTVGYWKKPSDPQQ